MPNILDFISNLTVETIPEAARRTARLCLLDAVGCLVSGIDYPPLLAMAKTIAEANPGSTAIAATPFSSTRAWASYTAMTAVELAAAGFDAMDPFLLDASQCKDLGRNWETCSVYFKMHACCRFSHPVLDGLSALIEENEITPDSIESITVQSFAKALLLGRTAPENPVAAMYSIPFAVASKLIKGEVGPQEMTVGSLSDRRILEIAEKVTIEENPELTALFPEKCLARIVLCLKDGTLIKSKTLSARGDPDNPYSEEELGEKFLRLTRFLPDRRGEEMLELIMNIEHEDPGQLWRMLQKR
jgi:2-methylcitrate dehydratase PrpD